jgi:hypothetical protein
VKEREGDSNVEIVATNDNITVPVSVDVTEGFNRSSDPIEEKYNHNHLGESADKNLSLGYYRYYPYMYVYICIYVNVYLYICI